MVKKEKRNVKDLKCTLVIHYLIILIVGSFFASSPLMAHEGIGEGLFEEISSRSYKKLPNGADSSIMLIADIAQFYQEVIQKQKATVVQFYSGGLSEKKDQLSFYQETAQDCAGVVDFLAVDMHKAKNVVNRLVVLFYNLAMRKGIATQGSVLEQRLIEILKLFVASQENQKSDFSFYLFFKNGHMIIPRKLAYATKKDFYTDIKSQLIESKIVPVETGGIGQLMNPNGMLKNMKGSEGEATSKESPDGTTLWDRMKDFAVKVKGSLFGLYHKANIKALEKRLGMQKFVKR